MAKKNTTVLYSRPIWLQQTETWLYTQANNLSSDINLHIACKQIQNIEQFRLDNIHNCSGSFLCNIMEKLGISRLKTKYYRRFLGTLFKKLNADILHSHFGWQGWAEKGIAKKADAKHVVSFYGSDVSYFPRNDARWLDRYKQLFESADLILCEGSFMGKNILNLGCHQHKLKIHHLGVDVDKITFKPRCWDPKEPLKVLIAGSFREKKGIPYALEALAKLRNELPVKITLIGDANQLERSRREKQKIIETIEKQSLEPDVRMLGYQPYNRLSEEAYDHHIFLSPSITSSDGDTEGGVPVSIIEMAASGMPIVSTLHCDIPYVILDNETGFLAQERDIDGIVKCLRSWLNSPENWASMLKEGREHIEQNYNAKKQGENLSEIYRELASN